MSAEAPDPKVIAAKSQLELLESERAQILQHFERQKARLEIIDAQIAAVKPLTE